MDDTDIDGKGSIVATAVALQPVLSVYVIVAVPAAIPFTIPVDEPMVAMVVLLLLHVPPLVASVSVVLPLTQALAVPDIAAGAVSTVSLKVAEQPELNW